MELPDVIKMGMLCLPKKFPRRDKPCARACAQYFRVILRLHARVCLADRLYVGMGGIWRIYSKIGKKSMKLKSPQSSSTRLSWGIGAGLYESIGFKGTGCSFPPVSQTLYLVEIRGKTYCGNTVLLRFVERKSRSRFHQRSGNDEYKERGLKEQLQGKKIRNKK